MLKKLIRLYTSYMLHDVRSPTPHMAGPPGVGKSEAAEQLASLLGVNLHVVNVSRISPLEIEGVQMPMGNESDMRLALLHNPLWTQLKEGDVVLFDEFLRGFPEVYNGLLDIFTSRVVAGYQLPKVFIIAASNSVATYDAALEDRLLHLFVPDLRSAKGEKEKVAQLLIDKIGLHPEVARTPEMAQLIQAEIEPMFEVLDKFKGKATAALQGQTKKVVGHSARNLIGQAKLREVTSSQLKELIAESNRLASSQSKPQYYIVLNPDQVDARYEARARALVGNPKLSEVQAINLQLNLDLMDMAAELREVPAEDPNKEEDQDDSVF